MALLREWEGDMKSKDLVFVISKRSGIRAQVDYFGLALLSQPDTVKIVLLGHRRPTEKRDFFEDTQQGHYRRWNPRKGTWKL